MSFHFVIGIVSAVLAVLSVLLYLPKLTDKSHEDITVALDGDMAGLGKLAGVIAVVCAILWVVTR